MRIWLRLFEGILLAVSIALPYASCRKSVDTGSGTELCCDTVYSPLHASGFDILATRLRENGEGGEATVIQVYNPWQGASDETRPFVILRNNDATPRNLPHNAQVIKGFPEKIVCMSSTQVAMIEALGLAEKIAGVSLIDFISSEYVRNNRARIKDVGYEGNIDYEKLVSLRPDIVLLYGINGVNPMEAKLKELGIPFMYVGEYLEESPLGKSEWIIPLGELLGVREKATEVFSSISERYHAIKNMASTNNATGKKKVMLNMPYQDFWYMPPMGSYMATLIEDAGGEYILNGYPEKKTDGNASITIDLEEALKMCSEADVWLNLGSGLNSREDIIKRLPEFQNTFILSEGVIFNNTLRSTPGGGNDFFESGVLHPDLLLEDISMILRGSAGNDSLHYYKRL